jgi:hypothetical protein
MDLEGLKKKLGQDSVENIINKYILCEESYFPSGKELILELKNSIAKHFDIHSRDIEIVGSAKLGFSLNPDKIGKVFNAGSDIDLVIVSSELFDAMWRSLLILEYRENYNLDKKGQELLRECLGTIRDGYISPNRFPSIFKYHNYWWKIFNSLSSKPKYNTQKVRGRLFKNWLCVEKYYSIQLIKLKGG